jgi:hypothetical protein
MFDYVVVLLGLSKRMQRQCFNLVHDLLTYFHNLLTVKKAESDNNAVFVQSTKPTTNELNQVDKLESFTTSGIKYIAVAFYASMRS